MTEQLATMLDEGGLLHAIYPSATNSLCGLDVDELEQPRVRDRSAPPGCGDYYATAERFDRIDRSAPSHWFRHLVATSATTT